MSRSETACHTCARVAVENPTWNRTSPYRPAQAQITHNKYAPYTLAACSTACLASRPLLGAAAYVCLEDGWVMSAARPPFLLQVWRFFLGALRGETAAAGSLQTQGLPALPACEGKRQSCRARSRLPARPAATPSPSLRRQLRANCSAPCLPTPPLIPHFSFCREAARGAGGGGETPAPPRSARLTPACGVHQVLPIKGGSLN